MKKKYEYLDGLKGLACVGVFLYHFYTTFSQQVNGLSFDASTIDFVFDKALKPLLDGKLMVMLFSLISGWLVAHSRICDIRELIERCIIRYFRFVCPVLPVLVAIKIVYNIGAFYTQGVSEVLGVVQLKNIYSNIGGY